MAEKKDAKKDAGKGAAKGGKKGATKLYKNYEVSGGSAKLKNKTCPKCGPSYLMANHKNRITCGKCHYTEFSSK